MAMNIIKIGALCSLFISSYANPISETAKKISKRDPCDGKNGMPVLEHEYREGDCPAKNKLNSQGGCSGLEHFNSPLFNSDCSAFCQIRTNFVYGLESPYPIPGCRGPGTCSISLTDTTTVSVGGTINAKWLEALGVGISGTFSTANAKAQSATFAHPVAAGECGYLTFVPVMRDVCGTMSESKYKSSYGGGVVNSHCDTDAAGITTTGNVCVRDSRKNSDGSVDGEVIFVKTDCSNRNPLPMDQQDVIYRKPGVAMDRGKLVALLATFDKPLAQQCNCNEDGCTAESPACCGNGTC